VAALEALNSGQGKTMTLRCAAYVRDSSDLQSPRSIEDQLRICREYALFHYNTRLYLYPSAVIAASNSSTCSRPRVSIVISIVVSPRFTP
jgi:hypothetical protein